MTTRDKYLIVAGTVLGLLVAGILFGASRLIWPAAMTAAVDVLRTWRLAREIVRYSADLVIVAPAAHEPAGLRIIKDDRSVDLVLGYNGAVWMHRPWKQVLDARIGATRSLGTTRLLAARVVKAAHVHAMPTEESPAHLMSAQVIAHLESRPKAQVINAVGWIREGGGLRYDTGRSVRRCAT